MRDNIINISLKDMQLPELLYQNDSGQRIKIKEDVPAGTLVSFTNKKVHDSALPVEVINQEAEIPNELLKEAGTLIVEIKIVESESTTTVYRLTGKIKESAEMGTIPPENQQTFIEQITEIANNAKSVADDVKQRADSGKFDGEPGPQGPKGDKGDKGEKGDTAEIHAGDGIKIENDTVSVDIVPGSEYNPNLINFSEGKLVLRGSTITDDFLFKNTMPYSLAIRQGLTDTRGSSAQTALASKAYVDNLINGTIKRAIVQTLPTQDIDTNTIYMLPKSTAETNNVYDEYMYINNAWERIGSTEVDLSNYYTKSETDSALAGKENTFSVAGHLSKSNGTLTNSASKNYDAVYDEDDEFSRDRDDYNGIKKNDLIFERLASGYYRIYIVMNDSGTLLLDTVGERISVSQNLITSNTGNKLYAVDCIVITHDGKMYRCTAVTDDGQIPPTYTYTWAEIRPDNRCYLAVFNNGNISYSPSDYPGIKYGDIAYFVSDNKVTFWAQAAAPDSVVYWTKQEVNDRHVYEEATAPPSSVNVSSDLYILGQIGDIWIAKVTANNETTIDVYLLTGITQVQTTKNLTWSNLTSGGSSLPSSTSSDAGKVLTVNSNGDAVWAEPVSDYSSLVHNIVGTYEEEQEEE